jgi:egghead protein (zeste-white 4 protein)
MARSLDEFPAVQGLVWFHSNKERDWRVDSSPAALEAFRTLSDGRPDSQHPQGPSTWDMRLKNGITVLTVFLAVYMAQDIIWDYPRQTDTEAARLWVWLGFLWCIPILSALFGLLGLISFRRPQTPIQTIDSLVSFRFVSRGTNLEVLRSAVQSVHEEMALHPLFPYLVEVVTDAPVDIGQHPNLRYLVVPADWQTENGSLYKARALHYACSHSDLPEDAWIMHCDEESHATGSLISGIAQAVAEEERSGQHRIGQGIILYHRNRERHPLTFLADMIRTGDDYGRYSLQTRLGWPLFGFHGSFILVRNSISKAVGFDFGPDGSITEDAFWSLVQMERGVRCRFVDGFMVEQSPQTLGDFVKQRRRWFLGIYKVVTKAPVARRYRLVLGSLLSVWSLGWLVIIYTLLNFYIGYQTPLALRLGGDVVFTYFISTYLIGLRVNLEESPTGLLKTFAWALAQLVTLPLHTVLEAAGVLYGLLRPDMGFHVIEKDPRPQVHPRPVKVLDVD